jgi:serine/threonine protein kinase
MTAVGDVIAGYRLEELVGRGGMGIVFRATHIALERQGAVKVITPELALNQEFRQRFQRESKLAASIDHPHVIPIFDAGEDDGQLYVAMRYVEGTDLGAVVAREDGIAPGRAVEVIGQVAAALDAAHDRGLVHRDVKPANVLLESRPSGQHAYLTDFGLVKAMGAATGVVTRTGQWLGTPDYAAPEQIMGGEVDARTDVYALGCLLYHAVAGKPPFEGEVEAAKIFAHVTQEPPALSDARPGVPAALDDVIRTALAKEPDERQQSAGRLAADATRAMGSTPATAPARSRPARVQPTPKPKPAARPGRRLLVPAAIAALLFVAAAVAVVASGGGDDDAEADVTIPAANQTVNPSFERGKSGWDRFESRIDREEASDAPNGEYVARVTLTGAPGEYSIDDFPETVSSSRQGRFYTASAWVKGTDANDGEAICISLREGLDDGGDVPFTAALTRLSAGEYREVRVTHRATASDETIGVHVFRAGRGMTEGEAFLVDAISLTEGAGTDPAGPAPECDV